MFEMFTAVEVILGFYRCHVCLLLLPRWRPFACPHHSHCYTFISNRTIVRDVCICHQVWGGEKKNEAFVYVGDCAYVCFPFGNKKVVRVVPVAMFAASCWAYYPLDKMSGLISKVPRLYLAGDVRTGAAETTP